MTQFNLITRNIQWGRGCNGVMDLHALSIPRAGSPNSTCFVCRKSPATIQDWTDHQPVVLTLNGDAR
jgi:hypothetical protein